MLHKYVEFLQTPGHCVRHSAIYRTRRILNYWHDYYCSSLNFQWCLLSNLPAQLPAVQVSWRIDNRNKQANSANIGARGVEVGFCDRKYRWWIHWGQFCITTKEDNDDRPSWHHYPTLLRLCLKWHQLWSLAISSETTRYCKVLSEMPQWIIRQSHAMYTYNPTSREIIQTKERWCSHKYTMNDHVLKCMKK